MLCKNLILLFSIWFNLLVKDQTVIQGGECNISQQKLSLPNISTTVKALYSDNYQHIPNIGNMQNQ